MPRYSDSTDEGPLDFPTCPSHEWPIYSEMGCPDCLEFGGEPDDEDDAA